MKCDDKVTREITKCHKNVEIPSILLPFSYKKTSFLGVLF
jgi:hypothetical protein